MKNRESTALHHEHSVDTNFDLNADIDVLLGAVDKSLLEPGLTAARQHIAINSGALTISFDINERI